MYISRRDFLRYCSASAVALGLSTSDLLGLQEALANPGAPKILWVHGSGCTGCSISFLNRVSVANVLVDSVNLVYHPNLMAVAGDSAVSILEQTCDEGGYILAVEGGVPSAFDGTTCVAFSLKGVDVTFQDELKVLAANAARILCIGDCAAWGGIPASGPNVTGVRGVKEATGWDTINIAGCPPHPDWIAFAISQLLLGNEIATDAAGRPRAVFGGLYDPPLTVHDLCPRWGLVEAATLGMSNLCMKGLGCRGPQTIASCPSHMWNNGANWCVGVNSPCIGCTEPTFPGTQPFYIHNLHNLHHDDSHDDD